METAIVILGACAGSALGLLSGYLLSYTLAEKAPTPSELVAILGAIAGGAWGDHMLHLGNPQISMALYLICLVPGYILYRYLLQRNLPRLKQNNSDKPPPIFPWLAGSGVPGPNPAA